MQCRLLFALENNHFDKEKNLRAASSLLRVCMVGRPQIIQFPEIKKSSSRIQLKVLTEEWKLCTIMLLMILRYHHLALLYNQGMLRRHSKLSKAPERTCINIFILSERGLKPPEISNKLQSKPQELNEISGEPRNQEYTTRL